MALIGCFIRERTWRQSALAKELDLTPAVLRKKLFEFQAAGIPLEREDDPPQVYWSVPKSWMPNTATLQPQEVNDLVRLLARLPNSAAKNRVLAKVFEGYVGARALKGTIGAAALPAQLAEEEERWLSVVEDAASLGEALQLRYRSASGTQTEPRELSPHRVTAGPRARFIATCHRDDVLKWFRVDRIESAMSLGRERARVAEESALAAMIETSVGGFRDGAEAIEHRFFVRDPEASWVAGNLPEPLTAQRVPGGIMVVGRAASVSPVARYVVGLGAAVRCESPELRAMVRELAEGALRGASEG